MAALNFQIITFYEFRPMPAAGGLIKLRDMLREAMKEHSIKGTIILASEGFNATVCGVVDDIARFIGRAEELLETKLEYKSSFHDRKPFHRIDVKIKPEIVTLKRDIKPEHGENTHVNSEEWNRIISDKETIVLDTRNDYEFQTGTFRRAINPKTTKFSELPEFVEKNLDPQRHKRVAMFCTGGVRCEKFAPFMKQLGFEEVYQLKGGILKYLEEIPAEESLWEGECFVFDDRVTVDNALKKGTQPDLSQSTNEPSSN
jgi:UPF0176 protein